MKLRVLVDNNTYIDRYYLGEPAVSYYIECDGIRLLFDAGYSDVFLKNAEALNKGKPAKEQSSGFFDSMWNSMSKAFE